MGPPELVELKKQLEDLEIKGYIQRSLSLWGCRTILMQKKDKPSHSVIEYHLLNLHTIKNKYPLPRINDCAKVFSKMDLRMGYH